MDGGLNGAVKWLGSWAVKEELLIGVAGCSGSRLGLQQKRAGLLVASHSV